jgi:hypothetical protein
MEIAACLTWRQANLEFELYFGNVPERFANFADDQSGNLFQNGNAISHLISLRITLVRT